MKKIYRFALVHLVGFVGSVGVMLSVMSLITWFYAEVVAPDNM